MNTAHDDHRPEPAGTEVPKEARALRNGGDRAGPTVLTDIVKLLARQAAREMFSATAEAARARD
jgi:hypothetical protein